MKKSILITFFILTYFAGSFLSFANASGSVFQGRAEKVDTEKQQSNLFTGSVDKLDKKDVIKMTVSQVLDADSSQVNDEFFAEVTDDVEGKDGVIIPRGTVAHGRIKKTAKAKKFGRNGELVLTFDTLMTPDGREIPIQGKMTTKLHPLYEASDIIKTNAVYATAGAAAGGLLALNWFGVGGAVTSTGTTIAGGAALGSSIGLGMACLHKGKDVLISPGDEILVKLNTSSSLPLYKKNAFPQQEITGNGLEVKINDINYKRNPLGNADTIKLSLSISNMTDRTFSVFDIAIVDNFNTKYYPNVFENEELKNIKINPKDELNCTILFAIDNVKNKLWLAFYDNQTKELITKISLDNAYKNIPDKSVKQNNKLIEKKNNFYKDSTIFDSD